MASTAVAARLGYTLTGEYLNIKQGKEWTDRDGNTRAPWLIVLLVGGDRVVSIEYRDQASAMAALEQAADGVEPQRAAVLAFDVFVRAKGKDWLQVSGVNLRADG